MFTKKKFDTSIIEAIDILIRYLSEAKEKNRGNTVYLRPRKIARYYRIKRNYQKLCYCVGLVLEELMYRKLELDMYRIHGSRVFVLPKQNIDRAIEVLKQIRSFYITHGTLPRRLLDVDELSKVCGGSESLP